MCCDLCRGGELDCLGPNEGYSTSVSESWYRVDCCLAASCKFCGRGDAPTTAQTGQYNLPLQRRGMVGVENF